MLDPNCVLFDAKRRAAEDRNMKYQQMRRLLGLRTRRTPHQAQLASHVGRANPLSPVGLRLEGSPQPLTRMSLNLVLTTGLEVHVFSEHGATAETFCWP